MVVDVRALMIVALLGLSACGSKTDTDPSAPPPEPKAIVRDFSQPIDARGVEPFWSLTIHGTVLTLTRPNAPVLTATAPGAVIQPGLTTWTGKLPDGQEMKVTLYGSACTDAMSGRAYAYAAEVDVPGEGPLSGCADTAAALAKPPAS